MSCLIDIAWPQVAYQRLILAEHIPWQKAVMIIIAMKETTRLFAMDCKNF